MTTGRVPPRRRARCKIGDGRWKCRLELGGTGGMLKSGSHASWSAPLPAPVSDDATLQQQESCSF